MKLVHTLGMAAVMLATALGAGTAEAAVTFRRGQFTDRVERGQPVGDAAAARAARDTVYWMEIGNDGAPTTVTLVWRLAGREVSRQQLEVGRGPRWRTWGSWRARGRSGGVEVQVLDAAGATLHTAQITE